jgi:hypothetical protein
MVGREIRLLEVKGYGWLLIGEVEGKEIYRGEYQQSYYECLHKFEHWQDQQE